MDVKFWLFPVIMLTTTVFSYSKAESSDDCEMLYRATIACRSNLFENENTADFYADMRSYVEDFLGVSLDDEEELHELVCNIVDASTMSEVAGLIKQDEPMLRSVMSELMSARDFLRGNFIHYKRQVRLMRRWVMISGFPDIWPLTVSKEDTVRFLNELSEPDLHLDVYIKVALAWGSNNTEVARCLTEATSLNDYREALANGEDFNEEMTNEFLMLPRRIRDKQAMKDICEAMKTMLNFTNALVKTGVSSLQ